MLRGLAYTHQGLGEMPLHLFAPNWPEGVAGQAVRSLAQQYPIGQFG